MCKARERDLYVEEHFLYQRVLFKENVEDASQIEEKYCSAGVEQGGKCYKEWKLFPPELLYQRVLVFCKIMSQQICMLQENGKTDFLIKRKCCSASVGNTVLRRVENVTRNGSSFRQNSAPCSYNPTQLYHRPPTLRPAIRARGRSFNIYLCKTASLSSPATFLTGAEHAIDAIDALHVKAHLQVFN